MENLNPNPSFWGRLSWTAKAFIIIVPFVLVIWGLARFGFIPGLHSDASKNIAKADLQNDAVNEKTSSKILPVPNVDQFEFADVTGRTQIRLMQYTWFGNAGLFAANGGLRTMKHTLMDKQGLDFRLRTDNSTDDMKAQQLAFISAYAKACAKGDSTANPSDGFQLVTQMGDGATSYIPAMNKTIASAYGPQYKLKVFAIFGFSVGEDCGIGPQKWIDHPETLRGSVWSAVIGDGDYDVVVRKFGGDDRMKINPDPGTWDPKAINFIPAPDGDFMKAATDVISGRRVRLQIKDAEGNLTGKYVEKTIEGAATWFPGDRLMFQKTNLVKLVSTAEYPNQMACVVVGSDAWLRNHSKAVVGFLSAALTATNQIKQSDEWFKYATDLAPKVFNTSASDATETAEDWYKFAKPYGGKMQNTDKVEVSAGGTQMANLADNLKYLDADAGNSVYKSVFDYMNTEILEKLNPNNFKKDVGEVVQYKDAVDLSYLRQVKIDAGQTEEVDFTKNKGKVVGNGTWNITFESGKADLTPSGEAELEVAFNLINTADKNANVKIVGHTDNTGLADKNATLSVERAIAVKKWFIKRSQNAFTSEKFSTDGRGGDEPIASNGTKEGRQQNRRVVITLLE